MGGHSKHGGNESSMMASEALAFSAIAETPAKVLGTDIQDLETWQDFAEKGTVVSGGTAASPRPRHG